MVTSLLATAVTTPIADVLITLIASGSLVGGIIALVKLGAKLGGADQDVAAFAQAHGANTILAGTLDEVTRDRDYWRQRHEDCQRAYQALVDATRNAPK